MRLPRFSREIALVVASAGVLVFGCASPQVFSGNGYKNPTYEYAVDFTDQGRRLFLPDDWHLDNFARDSKGGWKEKKGNAYVATRKIDEDGNGEVTRDEEHEESIYDLKYVNEHDGGVIWTKAHPIRHRDANLDLDVILGGYADSLAGRGTYYEGSVFSIEQEKSREFTTFVTDKKQITVDRHPAISAVIELAEVEKVKLDPSYRHSKVKIVVTRFAYSKPVNGYVKDVGWKRTKTADGEVETRRGILIAGYYNDVPHFDRSVPDFDHMVGNIRFPKSNPGPAPALSPVVSASASAPPPAPPAPPASASAAPSASAASAPPAASATPSSSAPTPASSAKH